MTKLDGAEQRLFTAAEARRIDIERGGEGIVRFGLPTCHRSIFDIDAVSEMYFDESWMLWRSGKGKTVGQLVAVNNEEQWLPLTALPEPVPEPDERRMVQISTKDWIDKCKQVEQLGKELAELKEKQRKKSCKEEFPREMEIVVFFDEKDHFRMQGSYHKGSWFVLSCGYFIEITPQQTKNWAWKYEADL